MIDIIDNVEDVRSTRRARRRRLSEYRRAQRRPCGAKKVTVGLRWQPPCSLAGRSSPSADAFADDDAPITERPRGPLSLILPAVFSASPCRPSVSGTRCRV
jgi:hypothetical protein